MFSWSLEKKLQGWSLILSVTKLPKESLDSGEIISLNLL
jgi:hypothetical protein